MRLLQDIPLHRQLTRGIPAVIISGRDSKEAIKLASDILALADKKRKEHLAVRHF
jgi:hypothetical protein